MTLPADPVSIPRVVFESLGFASIMLVSFFIGVAVSLHGNEKDHATDCQKFGITTLDSVPYHCEALNHDRPTDH